MKIAVISDIHGNIVALEAVLKDLARQGAPDCILIPGDMFAFGPAPTEVLARLQQLPNTRFLRGNTDRYLLEATYPTAASNSDWQNKLLLTFQWTAQHLAGEERQFLARLPSSQLIQEGQWQLLAVHGSPRSDEEGLTVKTQVEAFEQMAIEPQVTVIVCGHTHIPMDRLIARPQGYSLRVVNTGSVGLPFDGDRRACYALISNLTADPSSPTQVELRRVAYDVEMVIEQFYAADYPAADISAYNLRTGRSMASNLIYTPQMRHPTNP